MSSPALQDDRFLLLESLGRGGMGAVYRAFDRTEQRLVAVKVLSGVERPGPDHPLCAEFEVCSWLQHENIVRAHELLQARTGPLTCGQPYLILEHVAGGPVHRVFRAGRIEPVVLETVARQLLRALAHVHGCGFVHRDLKPSNVLVSRSSLSVQRIKLADFGLAAPVGTAGALGRISGSLPFISPEALLGLALDGRADLYALGILLYQLATGDTPANGKDADGVIHWHLMGSPADPSLRRPDLSPRLSRFVTRLTARDRDERPRSAAEALKLLGDTCEPMVAKRAVTAADRSALAKLRLALDAVRSGGSRTLHLPAGPAAAALAEQVVIWAQVCGLRFYRLRGHSRRGSHSLDRLVLRLLVERGSEAADCMRRYGLDASLAIGMLGNAPIADPLDSQAAARMTSTQGLAARAAGIARFLSSCAAQGPLLLLIEPGTRTEPLVHAVLSELEREISSARRPDSSGGVLLLHAPEQALPVPARLRMPRGTGLAAG